MMLMAMRYFTHLRLFPPHLESYVRRYLLSCRISSGAFRNEFDHENNSIKLAGRKRRGSSAVHLLLARKPKRRKTGKLFFQMSQSELNKNAPFFLARQKKERTEIESKDDKVRLWGPVVAV